MIIQREPLEKIAELGGTKVFVSPDVPDTEYTIDELRQMAEPEVRISYSNWVLNSEQAKVS